jgi:alpha-L-arabinofuranosidase
MKKINFVFLIAIVFQSQLFAGKSNKNKVIQPLSNTIHVSKSGLDSNVGTESLPLLTLSAASKIAKPGDVIMVHEGTYREWVKPEIGGTSEDKRITYRSAKGEKVYIKGSERITNWVHCENGVWMTEVPNTLFGDYNPYTLTVSGGWLEYGKWRHRGAVYQNGVGFYEVESINELVVTKNSWQVYTSEKSTTIHANFGDSDPNKELSEINVRESVFMPNRVGVNYITVDGFYISQAATNWTPPTDGLQMGAIGPRLGKYWIIENCDISHAKACGIVLGSAPGVDYTDINAYGEHIIRNNHIHHCGQAGLIGKFGATRSTITGNLIEEINYLREFGGWETAGIKFHHTSDVTISNNVIRAVRNLFSCAGFGIWIDYVNQGTRISQNIIYDIDNYCIHLEMNHGPMLIDNNVIIGKTFSFNANGGELAQHPGGVNTSTDGVVYAHNLFVDANQAYTEFTTRSSDYFKPHTTISNGKKDGTHREDKWLNNIFIRRGLDNTPFLRYVTVPGAQWDLKIKTEEFIGAPGMVSDFNLFLEGAKGFSFGDTKSVVDPFKTGFKLENRPTGVTIQFSMDKSFSQVKSPVVDKTSVGVFTTTGQTIEDKKGNAITVNTDINGKSFKKPVVGPVSTLNEGMNSIVWDIKR